jgi:hypothetical protein
MTTQTSQPFRFPEKTTGRLTAVVQDHAGVAIPAASLTTLVLTLYNLADGAIINSRSAQSVLNANGGTVDSSGNLVMILGPLDNVITGTASPSTSLADLMAARGSTPLPLGSSARSQVETHVALFEYTYDSGAKSGKTEVFIDVLNLAKVS